MYRMLISVVWFNRLKKSKTPHNRDSPHCETCLRKIFPKSLALSPKLRIFALTEGLTLCEVREKGEGD